MPAASRPFCVFYGTRTALVFAADEDAAFAVFSALVAPASSSDDRSVGRLMPPTRDEVNIRPLRAEDSGWIDVFHGRGAAPFIEALGKVDA